MQDNGTLNSCDWLNISLETILTSCVFMQEKPYNTKLHILPHCYYLLLKNLGVAAYTFLSLQISRDDHMQNMGDTCYSVIMTICYLSS